MNIRLLSFTKIAIAAIIGLASCSNQSVREDKPDQAELELADLNALTLLQNNCFSCHTMEMVNGKRVAPPLFMVRRHYLTDDISKEDFVNRIVHFVNNPTADNSIMPGAVRNFGLMPKQTFKEEDLQLIAAYIFENDFESDAWKGKWKEFKKQPKIQANGETYEDIGLNIANSTKAQLGKNLNQAIQNYGAAGAIEFCNTKAIPLTDSMARFYDATIKRVSDKPRNANNQASDDEQIVIQEMKNKLKEGEKLSPKVYALNDKVIGYYPIETNGMCLQCHGKPNTDILPETFTKIKQLYPDDKAIGYTENQLRGIWVVTMNKKQTP